jgi:hypothetical protein
VVEDSQVDPFREPARFPVIGNARFPVIGNRSGRERTLGKAIWKRIVCETNWTIAKSGGMNAGKIFRTQEESVKKTGRTLLRITGMGIIITGGVTGITGVQR